VIKVLKEDKIKTKNLGGALETSRVRDALLKSSSKCKEKNRQFIV